MHKPHAKWNADHACCFSRVLNILEVVWCPSFRLNQVVWVSSKQQEQIPRTMHKPHAKWNADHACCFSGVLSVLEMVWCPSFRLNQVVWVSSKKQDQNSPNNA